jgi:uridine phosphorylase
LVKADHLDLAANAAQLAIVTGDPARAGAIALAFGAELVSNARGFNCYLASQWHRPLVVVATGIGAPATAIVVEELIALGLRAIVRIGTCGALQREISPDQLVVASGCVRDEGTSCAYIDLAYPALADPRLAVQLADAGRAQGATVHLGITHCKDAYYSEKRGFLSDEEAAGRRWRILRAAGVLATEMEAGPLFIIAALRRIAAGAIFITVGKQRSAGFDDALRLAIAAVSETFRSFINSGALDALTPRLAATDGSYLAFERKADGQTS